jgi:FkbM family methyltransferase
MINRAHPAPLPVRAAAAVIRRLPLGRHRAAMWVADRVRDPFWAELPAPLGSLAFRCDLRDGLMRDAYLTGQYEPQETAIVRDLVRPGMTFADVGANWGYFTLVAAHLVGPSGRVICVEADPRAVSAIRANVQANDLATVTIVGAAATDVPRELRFQPYEPKRGSASGNYGIAQAADGDQRDRDTTVVVHGRPLDDIFDEARLAHIDVLKMDIEGGEAAALRGLTRSFASGRIDHVVLELHPDALEKLGTSMASVCAALEGAGFDGWWIDHSIRSHHRATSASVDVASLLVPLAADADLGSWPHVLWQRRGFGR